MKKIILPLKLLVMIVCILLIVLKPNKLSISQNNHYANYSFLQAIKLHEYKQHGIHEQTNVYIDKETGVNYICIIGRISGDLYFSITPRYGADGKVVITK